MARQVALSTSDNPFNPITDFWKWWAFDIEHGYHSCEYLARIAKTSDDAPDYVNERAVEDAIDEIVKFNLTGNYIKVVEET